MVSDLIAGGVDGILIPDTAVGYYMFKCRLVLMGSVAACQGGGVVGEVTISATAVARPLGLFFYFIHTLHRLMFKILCLPSSSVSYRGSIWQFLIFLYNFLIQFLNHIKKGIF